MTTKTITLMEIFFISYCGSKEGEIPRCAGCEFNVYGKGCVRKENPLNLYFADIEKGKI